MTQKRGMDQRDCKIENLKTGTKHYSKCVPIFVNHMFIYNFNGFNLLCTLDLDLLIKDSSKKKLVWEDIKKANREIDNEK